MLKECLDGVATPDGECIVSIDSLEISQVIGRVLKLVQASYISSRLCPVSLRLVVV